MHNGGACDGGGGEASSKAGQIPSDGELAIEDPLEIGCVPLWRVTVSVG